MQTAPIRAFMPLCKADPRYAANNSYRFLTAVPAGGRARRGLTAVPPGSS